MATPANRLSLAIRRAERQSFLIAKGLLQRAARISTGRTYKRVVFVAGVQRSGTNMMMNVLERSLKTDVYHERDPRAFEHYEMRHPEVIRTVIGSSPAPCVVVKALCELQDLRALLERFLPAGAVWLVRDVDDVVNSHLKLWTGMPESIRRIVEDGETAGWRARAMSADTREVLRRHYHTGLDNTSACALFWYFRNVLYFELALDRDPRVRLVHFERLVASPHETFADVFAFLGLSYTPRVSRRVFASSVKKAPPSAIAPDVRCLWEQLSARFGRLSAPVSDPSTAAEI